MVQTQNEFYGVDEEDNSKNHTQSKCKWYRLKNEPWERACKFYYTLFEYNK
jgi:hypothetical protein